MPDDVEVVEADLSAKGVIRRLLELTAHDHSEYDGRDVNEHGEFGYRYLDHYWTEPHRHPFLIRVNGQIAGFALVGSPQAQEDRAGTDVLKTFSMAEFFVLRKYRRNGVGREAAAELFRRFPGSWQVRQTPGNAPATAFWRAVVPAPFEEEATEDGLTQRFTTSA